MVLSDLKAAANSLSRKSFDLRSIVPGDTKKKNKRLKWRLLILTTKLKSRRCYAPPGGFYSLSCLSVNEIVSLIFHRSA